MLLGRIAWLAIRCPGPISTFSNEPGNDLVEFVAEPQTKGGYVSGKLLPIVENWTCCQSAECCRMPKAVLMTDAEFAVVLRHASLRASLKFSHPKPGWTELKAAPCPLLVDNQCSVYSVRPYVCRRFQCHREAGEAFDPSGPLGCRNLSDRLEHSRVTRRAYALNQRKAARWGLAHGWKGDEA
jgi:Fe-S-cluster containining protein